MTPAEELRAAAKPMREVAEHAQGRDTRWTVQHHDECDSLCDEPCEEARECQEGDCDHQAVIGDRDGIMIYPEGGHNAWQAEHIASWHPAVALAVADWLECAAALIDATVFPHSDDVIVRYPLAVARAYLGEPQ